MLRFITGLGEVQVMLNRVRLVSSELDRHIEFTPSLLLNTERRVLENYLKWTNRPTLASNRKTTHTPPATLIARPWESGSPDNPKIKNTIGTKHTLRGTFTETGVQVVGDLVEDVRGDQGALLVHEPDLNMP